ncbi:hypothetical protein [Rhodoferax sp.]|uniref:pilus assembly PilX family protein n=1 Tax=Rhodoferax sp. TaxID=50421 RepID=UPI0019D89CB4|nr:hypothetical protein [Rhodoferax sp.]MBE0472945.1 hypothetical protein [Rhodoferax sp.]
MNHMNSLRRQRGATLIVGLIMLVLITLMMVSAFMLSGTNLKAVGNMQYRDEAIAAANVAIERVVSTDFMLSPVESTETVTIGGAVYTVKVETPVCIKSIGITLLPNTDHDYDTCVVGGENPTPMCFDTVWEIEATVSPTGAAATTGAVATLRQGIGRRVNVTAASSCD